MILLYILYNLLFTNQIDLFYDYIFKVQVNKPNIYSEEEVRSGVVVFPVYNKMISLILRGNATDGP